MKSNHDYVGVIELPYLSDIDRHLAERKRGVELEEVSQQLLWNKGQRSDISVEGLLTETPPSITPSCGPTLWLTQRLVVAVELDFAEVADKRAVVPLNHAPVRGTLWDESGDTR